MSIKYHNFDWRCSITEMPQATEKCLHCCGSDGKAKDVYKSESDARQRAQYIERTRHGTRLYVYRCPFGNGFHLTKKIGRG